MDRIQTEYGQILDKGQNVDKNCNFCPTAELPGGQFKQIFDTKFCPTFVQLFFLVFSFECGPKQDKSWTILGIYGQILGQIRTDKDKIES